VGDSKYSGFISNIASLQHIIGLGLYIASCNRLHYRAYRPKQFSKLRAYYANVYLACPTNLLGVLYVLLELVVFFLARSTKLPTGLYILLSVISFFHLNSSSLMISLRQIIAGSTGQIFAIFSLNESVLGADD